MVSAHGPQPNPKIILSVLGHLHKYAYGARNSSRNPTHGVDPFGGYFHVRRTSRVHNAGTSFTVSAGVPAAKVEFVGSGRTPEEPAREFEPSTGTNTIGHESAPSSWTKARGSEASRWAA